MTAGHVPAAIEARGLVKRFRPRHDQRETVTVLDGLHLDVLPGELLAVTGPSLTGKTTLVELLAGWTRADAGTITWSGWSGSTTAPPWSWLTVVPQSFALLEELTVLENIDLAARFDHGGTRARRRTGRARQRDAWRDDLLARLGLDHLRDRAAFEVSVGERQRTMVARALVERPAVIVADEPVAHQDERHASVVLGLLRAAVDDGAACLLASRSPEVARDADRAFDLASA